MPRPWCRNWLRAQIWAPTTVRRVSSEIYHLPWAVHALSFGIIEFLKYPIICFVLLKKIFDFSASGLQLLVQKDGTMALRWWWQFASAPKVCSVKWRNILWFIFQIDVTVKIDPCMSSSQPDHHSRQTNQEKDFKTDALWLCRKDVFVFLLTCCLVTFCEICTTPRLQILSTVTSYKNSMTIVLPGYARFELSKMMVPVVSWPHSVAETFCTK